MPNKFFSPKIKKDGDSMQDLKIHDDVSNFKVRNDSGTAIPTKVSINGLNVRCRAIDYHADIESVPTCTVELVALGDIEVNHAAIRFSFTPHTITDAVKILRHELSQDTYLRKGFLESIKSALKDAPAGMGLPDVAQMVLDRLVGAELHVYKCSEDCVNCNVGQCRDTNGDGLADECRADHCPAGNDMI